MIRIYRYTVTLSSNSLLLSRTSRPNRSDTLRANISYSIGLSSIYSGVYKNNPNIPLYHITLFPDWKSRSDQVIGIELRSTEKTILLRSLFSMYEIGVQISKWNNIVSIYDLISCKRVCMSCHVHYRILWSLSA